MSRHLASWRRLALIGLTAAGLVAGPAFTPWAAAAPSAGTSTGDRVVTGSEGAKPKPKAAAKPAKAATSTTAAKSAKPAKAKRVGKSGDEGLISITFDDGYGSQFKNGLPVLRRAGNLPGTFYLVPSFLNTSDYMTTAQAKQLQAAGSEIGSHSVTHVDLTTVDDATLTKELRDSKSRLERNFGPITSFAYPFGSVNAKVKAETAKYYASARSTESGVMKPGSYDRYALTIGYVLNTTSQATVDGWIKQAKDKHRWLVLCYHHISDSDPNDPYTVSVKTFRNQISAVRDSGVRVVTVRDGVKLTSQAS